MLAQVSHGERVGAPCPRLSPKSHSKGEPCRSRFASNPWQPLYGSSVRASNGARNAITEAFGEDLLEPHRVMKRNQGMIEDADLTLVMDEKLRSGLPPKKTYLLSEFFGSQGDVENPWPDYKEGAEQKYRKCLAQLRSLIGPNAGRLISVLECQSATESDRTDG